MYSGRDHLKEPTSENAAAFLASRERLYAEQVFSWHNFFICYVLKGIQDSQYYVAV